MQFHFRNKDGQADGLIIDIWRLWSERTGIAVDFKAASWAETLAMVGDGTADAHAGLFFNDERDKYLEYGTSLTETDTHFFVHKDLPGIVGVEDLAAYKVGVLSGDFVEGFLRKKLPPENIVGFESYEAIMAALRQGKLQVFAADTSTGIFHLQKSGLGYVFETSAKPLYSQEWFVAAAKGNTELIKTINDGMALVSISDRREIERRWASISNPVVFEAERAKEQLNLTAPERQWLAAHPVIRVHNERNWPPFNFFDDGRPQGFSIDYMNLLAANIGVKIDYVTGPTWNEFLGLMKGGELDVMLNIVKTPERQKYLLFTKPYAYNPNTILSRRDAPYDDLGQLAGKTVALPKGFFYEEILTRDFPEIKLLLVDNVPESMKLVAFGKADAALGELAVFNYILGREMMTDLVLSGEVKLGGSNYTQLNIAARKDLPLLVSILGKAMDAVPPEKLMDLRNRWINVATTAAPKAVRLQLTDAEKTWLAAHKTIRLGVDPNYPPFEFTSEDGAYSGMASDYVRLIGARLGITLEVVPGLSWSQAIEGVQGGRVDLLPAVTKTPERDKYMNFSREHLIFPNVILMRDNHALIAGLPDMKGRTVALVKGYASTEHLKLKYPAVRRHIVGTPLLALKAVADGKADATVLNLGVATYLIKKHDLTNLVVAAPAGLELPGLSFGVRKDWPELVPIIDKALASISPEEEAAIREKWGSSQYQIGISAVTVRRVALQAGGGIAVIVVIIVLWNRRLSREVRQRKMAEEALAEKNALLDTVFENMDQGVVMYNSDLVVTAFNEQAQRLFQYPDGVLFVGAMFKDLLEYSMARYDPETRQRYAGTEDHWEFLADGAERISEHTYINGTTIEIRRNLVSGGGFVATQTDVTERKRAEQELAEKEAHLRVALDNMPGGMALIDQDGNFVIANSMYSELHDFPEGLVEAGESIRNEVLYQAERGDYGPGDTDELVEKIFAEYSNIEQATVERTMAFERTLAHGRTLNFNVALTPDGGYVVIATDITERKQAEQELAEKEAHLRVALDNMPGGMLLADREGKFIIFNAEYGALHEYPDGLLEIGGTVVDTVRFQAERGDYGPGDTDELIEQVRAPYEHGETVNYERTITTGRTLFFSVAPTPEGGYVTIVTDITERKRSEKVLAEKEALLRLALDNMPGGLVVHDREFNYVVVNDWIKNFFGAPAGLMDAGQPTEGLLRFLADQGVYGPGNTDDLVKQRLDQITKPQDTVSEITMPDGRILQLRRQPLDDGGNAVVFVDITEIKQAEKAVSDQLKFVEALVDTLPNPVFVKDAGLRYTILNRAFQDVFGIAPEQHIGQTVMDIDYLSLPLRRELRDEDRQLIRTGGTRYAETTRRYADGKDHDVLYWQTRFELSDGEIGGLVGLLVDVSEQKNLERELAESREQFHSLANSLQVALSSMSDGIYIIDGNLNFVAFNQRYIDMLDFPDGLVHQGGSIVDTAEFAAKRGDYGDQFAGDIEEIVASRIKQFRSNNDYVIENVTPTGRIIEYRGSPIEGGGFVSIMHDITKRKQDADALETAHGIIKQQNERMEEELNVGHDIQMSMVPLQFPPFPGHDEFSLHATLKPAREVGGDFYDFYFLDEDHLCVCIGDVSGKGVPAALFMAVAKTLIKTRAGDDRSTASILTHVNEELSVDNGRAMFVTVFAAIMNIKTGEMVYTNAGHNPPYLKQAGGTLRRMGNRHGPVVGALEGMVYKEDRVTMLPGDMLVLFTDGITEAMDASETLFSEERFVELLARAELDEPDFLIEETLAAIVAFSGEAEQTDDITLLALKFHGTPEDSLSAEQYVVIKNKLPDIVAVNETFEAFAETFHIPPAIAVKFNIIFDELLNNIISYAYVDDEEHNIEVRMKRTGSRLNVTISDDGTPFNPLSLEKPDTELSLEDRDIGGMGIHLVRNLVDEVFYHRRIGRNVITIIHKLEH
ncbi:MAG: transporter substrate-binding domain-containing protein, partial [Rhodospirillaceae bacterium]|nr:transporter substrate-binding domain-containing protein [Rhodospirillaceae bacterium]